MPPGPRPYDRRNNPPCQRKAPPLVSSPPPWRRSSSLPEESAHSNDRLNLRLRQGMEAGHPGSGDAIVNDAENLNVRKPLHASCGDTRRSLTAPAIETVTARAAWGKNFPAIHEAERAGDFFLGAEPPAQRPRQRRSRASRASRPPRSRSPRTRSWLAMGCMAIAV